MPKSMRDAIERPQMLGQARSDRSEPQVDRQVQDAIQKLGDRALPSIS